MRELLKDLERWRRQGKRVAIVRVVDLEGSGPRDPGAAMAVSEDGEVVGSVSGGCVESAVVTEALEILDSGGRRIVTFGYSDDEAFAVGLTCGGTIHLFIEPDDHADVAAALTRAVADHRPVALATVIEGPGLGGTLLVDADGSSLGTLGDRDLDRVVARDASAEIAGGTTGVRHYGAHGEARVDAVVAVFIESFAPPPELLVFGAVDFTSALVRIGKVIGYRVTVCDAREVFATRKRFPMADEVVVDWPNRLLERVGSRLGSRDAVCVLTHDAKFDVPTILAALDTDVGYIGAMGSRRTHADRVARLRAEGVDDAGLARVMGPIGLDLGARTPEETAIAIVGEMIALRTGRSGAVGFLRDLSGSIRS